MYALGVGIEDSAMPCESRQGRFVKNRFICRGFCNLVGHFCLEFGSALCRPSCECVCACLAILHFASMAFE